MAAPPPPPSASPSVPPNAHVEDEAARAARLAAARQVHKGQCFCGAVKFDVTGVPEVMGYCHCTDCASWAGAPINAFSLWPKSQLKVTDGADLIGSYAKTPKSHRKFCKTCGGHIFTDHPKLELVDVYLNTVQGIKHEGKLHVFYGEKTLAVRDGLPKFKDLPANLGGSGVQLPE